MRRISPPGRHAGLFQQAGKRMHVLRCGADNQSAMHARTPVLLLIALLFVTCSGCITLEKDDEPDPVEPLWPDANQPFPGETAPVSSATWNLNTVAPVDPVPVQPGEHLPNLNPGITPISMIQVNTTKPVAEKTKVFEEYYTFYHSAQGLQVDVVDVPFIITFSTTPRHPEPDATRLVVTVRNSETLQLVADEGYNGIYGSDQEKSITLYRAGRYTVTLDGQLVDVAVTMSTEMMNIPE